jgi:hypothetical protein
MSERVILAYSGGLDTSVAVSWIGKETGRESSRSPSTSVRAARTWRSSASGRSTAVRSRPSWSTPGRVRRRVLPARDQVQRALHGPLPAGVGTEPATDREAPGGRRHASSAAASSPTAARARATTRSASRSGSPRWRQNWRCSLRSATTRGRAKRRSRSPRRTTSRSTSRSAHRSRSIRTCGAARWKPVSWNTSGMRPPRTSTTTPRTPPSTGAHPTRSSSASPRACRYP